MSSSAMSIKTILLLVQNIHFLCIFLGYHFIPFHVEEPDEYVCQLVQIWMNFVQTVAIEDSNATQQVEATTTRPCLHIYSHTLTSPHSCHVSLNM